MTESGFSIVSTKKVRSSLAGKLMSCLINAEVSLGVTEITLVIKIMRV